MIVFPSPCRTSSEPARTEFRASRFSNSRAVTQHEPSQQFHRGGPKLEPITSHSSTIISGQFGKTRWHSANSVSLSPTVRGGCRPHAHVSSRPSGFLSTMSFLTTANQRLPPILSKNVLFFFRLHMTVHESVVDPTQYHKDTCHPQRDAVKFALHQGLILPCLNPQPS